MKKLLLIVSFICLNCGLNAQSNGRNTVIENMKKQEAAWHSFDIEGFMKYYWNSDSLKFIGSKGITYGWQKYTRKL